MSGSRRVFLCGLFALAVVVLIGVAAAGPADAGEVGGQRSLSLGEGSLVRPSASSTHSFSQVGPPFSRRLEGRYQAEAISQGEAERVAAFLSPAATGGSGGQVGVLVRAVGAQSPLFALNASLKFEPASSIKTLLLLEAVQAVERGDDAWTDPVVAYAYPSSLNNGGNPTYPGLCPVAADEVAENVRPNLTLGEVARGMMWASDNTFTRAILLRYGGLAPAVALAAKLGMSDTTLGQDLMGCGYQGGKRNFSTLTDLARLYDSAVRGVSVRDAGRFFALMPSGRWDSSSTFASMLDEEAHRVGLRLSSADRAGFLAASFVASKGGSYIIGCGGAFAGDPPVCPPGQVIFGYSVAGVQTLPFKDPGGAVDLRTYTFGNFIEERLGSCGALPSCGDNYLAAINRAYLESFRALTREALVSWKIAANDPPRAIFTASPTSVSVGESVSLDAGTSSDLDGSIANYEWDLGDGSDATGRTVRHRYARPGIYTVGLTVTDDLGESNSASRAITVTSGAPRIATPMCLGRRATIVARAGRRARGTAGPDVIVGTHGRDVIDGRGGNDLICSGKGADRVLGAHGIDRILAGQGNDRLRGGMGNDRLSGGAGRDNISGGPGRDRITGGSGQDRIDAVDTSRDRADCGAGSDRATADPIDRLSRCELRVRRRAS